MLAMGGTVEKAIDEACAAVIVREPQRFALVHQLEQNINQAHMQIDQVCFNLIARQAPVAKDLRFILAVYKINNDLERMGDQAVNIAYSGEDYLQRPRLAAVPNIGQMASEVRGMVKDSLDAFVRKDIDLSKEVLKRDDSVDQLNRQMRNLMTEQMHKEPSLIEACLDLMGIARNLERVADHATNIAEEVIFVTTGDDIRHGHLQDT